MVFKNLEKLSDKELRQFAREVHRYECIDHEVQYIKAIRATLLALGYDSDFVENKLRDILVDEYMR